MIQSFRLRLALLSALLTGLVLVAFGFGSWWLIRSIKIERMDSEIRTFAEREVIRVRDETQWRNEEVRIAAGLGVRDPGDLLLLVEQHAGAAVYRSAHWPDALDSSTLPWPEPQRGAKRSSFSIPLSSAFAGELPGTSGVLLAQAGLPSGQRPERGMGPGAGFGPGPDGPPPDRRPPLHPRERTESRQTPGADNRPAATTTEPTHLGSEPAAITQERSRESSPTAGAANESIPASPTYPVLTPLPQDLPSPPPALLATPTPDHPQPPPQTPPMAQALSRTVGANVWRINLTSTEGPRLAVAVNVRVIESDMKGIRNAFLVAMPFALVLIGMGSWLFSGRALRPVSKLTEATRKVTVEGLSQRLDAKGEDREFVELIEVFNRMLGRLERSFQQAHRFTADAAHELKTPLAIVQGQLERAINQCEDSSPMQSGLSSVLDEVRRLSVISRKLLLLSQADAGRLTVFRETVDLSRLLEDLLEDTRMLAPNLSITGEIQPGLTLQADGSLLRQVLHNLISNAIKYNIDGGWIRISTTRWTQRIEVVVTNASNGIPSAERGKIFERFFRADPAHSRNVEGVGLGLSVSREIARAHGGDLTLKGDAAGSVQFSLLLPL